MKVKLDDKLLTLGREVSQQTLNLILQSPSKFIFGTNEARGFQAYRKLSPTFDQEIELACQIGYKFMMTCAEMEQSDFQSLYRKQTNDDQTS